VTSPETYHDIEPYAVKSNGAATAHCLTHNTTTSEIWGTLSAAVREFRCDEGRNLRFITESDHGDGAPVPVMRDLTGLARLVRHDAEDRAYCGDDHQTRAWLWAGGGNLEPLTIDMTHMSEFNADSYATQTWQVTAADGQVIVSVRVQIDGRS
jgi:hypothetical protein